MNKKKATEETVNAFIKAVYPGMAALATTFGSEDSILKDATEKIAAQDGCILHFQARVAAMTLLESLKRKNMPQEEIRVALDLSDAIALIERQQQEIADLKVERDDYLSVQQQMQDTCSRLQDSIAKYAKERKTLKSEMEKYKAFWDQSRLADQMTFKTYAWKKETADEPVKL